MTQAAGKPAAKKLNSRPLSAKARRQIDGWIAKYPPGRKRSAVLAALTIAQEENLGHLSTAVMDSVADYLELPQIAVYEVASFYSMFDLKPVGRHKISICNNIACMLTGADDIVRHVEQKLGIRRGQSSPDGKFYLIAEEECLAACGGGPMMTVNGHYYENLTTQRVNEILDNLE